MKRLLKKAAVFLILAALTLTYLPVIASAETIEWDGKSELLSGNLYTVKKEVKISSDLTIPKGAVLNVTKDGILSVSKSAVLEINGELAVSTGGTLEIKKADVNVRKSGKLSIFGILMQYAGSGK